MVFFSSVGGGIVLLEKTFLLPFHHFSSNKKKGGFKSGVLLIPPGSSSYHHLHLSSVGLHQSLQPTTKRKNKNGSFIFCCSSTSTTTTTTDSSADNFSTSSTALSTSTTSIAPLIRKRKRYRKQYPGESKGIAEEMRFVAMRLRNTNNSTNNNNNNNNIDDEDGRGEQESSAAAAGEGEGGETWQPSIEGFLKYLVNSKLVFQTLERVVDESDHVAYTYFRKTGLERSEGLAKDLEWFRQQNLVIPEPSIPGVSYAQYLEELAEKSAPFFLCHFYNVYFAHISGGQVIAKQVSEKLLEGRELEFYKWEGDVPELLKDVRENLNKLGEHWTRDDKNKCLREAAKSFRFLGQIVRLIIL